MTDTACAQLAHLSSTWQIADISEGIPASHWQRSALRVTCYCATSAFHMAPDQMGVMLLQAWACVSGAGRPCLGFGSWLGAPEHIGDAHRSLA